MLGSPAGHAGGNTQRGLWPLAPAPAPPASHISSEGYSRYGVYSLFPGAGSPAPGVGVGAALYSHSASTIGRFGPGQPANPGQASATTFHTAHKVTDSLYSTSNYTFGAPTPPPGSPYSPVPVAQLELLAKGISSSVASHVQNTSSNHLLQIKKTISLDEKCVSSHCEDRCWSAIKSEKRTSCNCPSSSPLVKTKFADTNSGCSRTNPVDWSSSGISVKREPGAGTTPCQVAEVTTSDGTTTASAMSMVKVEVGSPTISNKTEVQVTIPQSITNGNIPIGIAVARQRLQQDLPQSPNLGPSGLLTPINHNQSLKDLSRLSELDTSSAGMAAAATGGGSIGGTLLQCADDRGAGLAAWPMGGTHGSALTTPTLWQYPAPMPLEPMLPMPIPMPPVGFQLIRDPASGHFLLIPTATLEQLQQAVVWPSYPQPSSHVLLPPLPPPPLAPLQLLSSASSDYLATSTTLHQHTQTHSTRLVAVTTDTKRKMTPLPTHHHTLIKIEADCTQSAATSIDNTKHSVSTTNTGSTTTMYDTPVTPLLTTHLFYQHPTNLILSNQTECKSQATSPVTCLTPPPEQSVHDEDSVTLFSVQDASNQTETHIFQEDEEIRDEQPSDLSMKPAIKTDFTAVLPIKEPETTTVDEIETKCVAADTSAEIVEEKVVTKPDISGLELLSNSIVEFENNRQSAEASPIKYELKNENDETPVETNEDVLNGIAHMTLKDRETDAISTTQVDDTLGGLGLLCALAEQRFMEEVDQQDKKEIKTKREKKLKRTYDQQQQHQLDSKTTKRFKTSDEDLNEHEIRENELELERERLNVLKRVTDERGLAEKAATKRDLSYELSECDKRYKTDKYRQDDCSCKREENQNRKYTNNNNNCNNNNNNNNTNKQSRDWSLRQQIADLQRQYKEKKLELSKLNPEQQHQKCPELKKIKPLKKLKDRSLSPPVLDKIEDIPIVRQNLLKPPTLCAVTSPDDDIKPIESSHKRKSSISQDSCDSTPEKISSSKKRKVGRPKKLMSAHGLGVATETIVAKKPRSKSSLVGYLLAAKKHLQMQNKSEAIFAKTNSPIRYVDEKPTCNSPPTLAQHKKTKAAHKASKIRPKLKAETKIKTYTEDEDDSQVSEWEIASQSCATKEAIEERPTVKDTRCILTAEHLEIDKLRVLTAMGGLFYAGQLTAIQAPDVYAITLDGERGNRPHIMSREEILRDAIVEVSPKSTTELSPGTRLCAYWSQQYRCLYPGTVAEPGTPNPQLDLKFICVEFDDGDSGTIALEDIRLLPVDYPIIEYDPNPLLSLSKRRRRTSVNSVTEERHLNNKQTASALITVDAKPITTPLAEKRTQTSIGKRNNKIHIANAND